MLRRAIALCLVLTVGAACTGDDEPGTTERTTETTAAPVEIKIGALFDISGPTAQPGTPYAEGVRDYVEHRNSRGGVEGHRLVLLQQDFGYQVPRAEQLYAQYVSEGVRAIVGWAADDTDALRPRVTADRIPYLSASWSETLADPKVAPYNFVPGVTYSQQLRIVLHWIAGQHKAGQPPVEVAFFHHDSPFGTAPLDDGKRYIADRQLPINLKSYRMPITATDFSAPVGQAKVQGARYVIVQNVAKPAAQLARDLAAQKTGAQLICLNWCADELFVDEAGPAAEKVIGVMPFAPPEGGSPEGAKADGVHYLKGWFTMAALAEGIANAVRGRGGRDVTGEEIKAGLERIAALPTGVSAPVTFGPDRHAGLTAAPLYRIENGRFRKFVDPIEPDR